MLYNTKRHGKLSGKIEVDEFYLGGRCSGKRGRGAEHEYPVAAAVEKKGKSLVVFDSKLLKIVLNLNFPPSSMPMLSREVRFSLTDGKIIISLRIKNTNIIQSLP
jgi:hypothetical protein